MLGLNIRKTSNLHKLAIIGNGFDLAHNYKTLYSSFVNSTSSPVLDKFKEFCNDEPAIKTWYDFENNINTLTHSLYLQSLAEEQEYEENRNKVAELRDLFSALSDLLIDYLQKEIANNPFEQKESIKKNLDSKTIAINFNYTDTAKKYIKNVIDIHGSLEERDIILGYDYRDEPCLAQYEDMCWSKTFCRESLALRRFLRKWNKIINSKKQKVLISSLESYHHWENSGRGIDEEIEKCIPSYRFIDRFISKQRRKSNIDRINYSQIDTIIVLGHGIEADRVLLEKIISKCTTINEVIIYRYEGESDDEYGRKEDFFKPYCKKITEVFY